MGVFISCIVVTIIIMIGVVAINEMDETTKNPNNTPTPIKTKNKYILIQNQYLATDDHLDMDEKYHLKDCVIELVFNSDNANKQSIKEYLKLKQKTIKYNGKYKLENCMWNVIYNGNTYTFSQQEIEK